MGGILIKKTEEACIDLRLDTNEYLNQIHENEGWRDIGRKFVAEG
jgi:hypothetical protein